MPGEIRFDWISKGQNAMGSRRNPFDFELPFGVCDCKKSRWKQEKVRVRNRPPVFILHGALNATAVAAKFESQVVRPTGADNERRIQHAASVHRCSAEIQ